MDFIAKAKRPTSVHKVSKSKMKQSTKVNLLRKSLFSIISEKNRAPRFKSIQQPLNLDIVEKVIKSNPQALDRKISSSTAAS